MKDSSIDVTTSYPKVTHVEDCPCNTNEGRWIIDKELSIRIVSFYTLNLIDLSYASTSPCRLLYQKSYVNNKIFIGITELDTVAFAT